MKEENDEVDEIVEEVEAKNEENEGKVNDSMEERYQKRRSTKR